MDNIEIISEDADLFVQCFMEKDMFTEMLHIN